MKTKQHKRKRRTTAAAEEQENIRELHTPSSGTTSVYPSSAMAPHLGAKELDTIQRHSVRSAAEALLRVWRSRAGA